MKFLDENLSPLHAGTLRALGYDAIAVVEMHLSGAIDTALRFAVSYLDQVSVAGKLVVVDERKIRIRG